MLNHAAFAIAVIFCLFTQSVVLANHWQIVETDDYVAKAPQAWKVAKGVQQPGPDFSFEVRGMIPETFNDKPTFATGYIARTRGTSLENAIQSLRTINRANRDRVFVSDSDQVTYLTLSTGSRAAIIKSQWTRMSRDIQQTRYDLLIHLKDDIALNFVVIFAYADKGYTLESAHGLDTKVREIFEQFALKKQTK